MRSLLLLMVAGCVQSSTVVCGDLICPEETTCRHVTSPDAELCVTKAQLDACDPGSPDGKCTVAGVTAGRCYDGVCLPGGCGNGRVDPGEQCDDGNQAAADGCSADCTSTELCGNHVIDFLQGETCDDGNYTSHDGCTSTCAIEQLGWEQALLDQPRPRELAGIAYDPVRRQVVMFGGVRSFSAGDAETDETWIWNGFAWQHVVPAISPPARAGASMTYDATRDRIVLFGGRVQGIDLGDTWEWDGATWTVRESTSSPPPRAAHAMTFDASRDLVELFGGETYGHAAVNDLWEWDGDDWTQRASMQPPAARTRHAFVFDPRRGVSVVFGGVDNDSTEVFGDTWEWNGTAWTMRGDDPAIARSGAGAAFDTQSQRVVMTGGDSFGARLDETRSWSGIAWQLLATTGQPKRSDHMLAADLEHKRLVQFGGRDDSSSLSGTTHELVGSAWQMVPTASFAGRQLAGSAFDDLRRRGVLFGGTDTNNITKFADTWEIIGASLTKRAPTPQSPITPSARVAPAMAYDSAHHQTVLFGGDSTGPQQDTWVWDGALWSPRMPTAPPPARDGAAMAFDRERGRIVMFGGGSFGAVLADTWEWDGAAWTQRAIGAAGPPGRRGAAMAYDPVAKLVVLFGGDTGAGFLDDTWTWDGAAWKQLTPATKPASRGYSGLTYSANRGHLVLFAGRRSGNAVLNDAWEWDGAGWQRLVVPATPPARFGQAQFSADDGSGITVLGGAQLEGTGLPRSLADLWRLRWRRADAPDELCRDDRDRDGDQQGGCADLDCWYACKPLCPPGASCAAGAPSCGDHTCDAFETCTMCPADCGACPVVCGDNVCSPGEQQCPGDC